VEDPAQLFASAEQDFVAGRYGEAAASLDRLRRLVGAHPAALHLSGLVASALGDEAAARRHLEAAHRLAPRDPQIANNLGNLLGRTGEGEAALRAYDSALAAMPGFSQAAVNKALTLASLGRTDEARTLLRKLARADPANASALVALGSLEHEERDLDAAADAFDRAVQAAPGAVEPVHGRARVALERGEPRARALYERARAVRPDDPDLFLDWVRALHAERDPKAVTELRAEVARQADRAEAVGLLSSILWELGDRETYLQPFEDALASRPRDEALWRDYVAAVVGTKGTGAAAEAAARAVRATGAHAFRLAEAEFLSSSGRLDEAETLFATLGEAGIALAEHRLRRLDVAAAEALATPLLETSEGPDIRAWALVGLCWRLASDDRAAWLHEQPGLIGTGALDLDAAEVERIAERLRRLHQTAAHPIGQSVRGGTQTRGDLFDRVEPEVRRMRAAIAEAVETHRSKLPASDPRHPLLRFRDRALRFSASWSIRLTGGGFHVSHIHPKGLLSSASYWALPPAGDDPTAGWLAVGGHPNDLPLPVEPLVTIEPRVGMLALFPSTLHHGTRPFPAGERITAAFDVAAR
jgi:tetratricopeptide (TPR) repeat protein